MTTYAGANQPSTRPIHDLILVYRLLWRHLELVDSRTFLA